MKRNDYVIAPVELSGPAGVAAIRHHCVRRLQTDTAGLADKFFNQRLLRESFDIKLDAGCLLLQGHEVPGAGRYNVYVALQNTSLCFVLHRSVEMEGPKGQQGRRQAMKDILRNRRSLHQALLEADGRGFAAIVDRSSLPLHDTPSYVFSFFVFEGLTEDDRKGWNPEFRILADPSVIGIEPDAGEEEEVVVLDNDAAAADETGMNLSDIDRHPDSVAYATWSTIVAACWGETGHIERTKAMVLGLELKLQAAWNKCHELSGRIEQGIDGGWKDDPEQVLVGFTRALESIRGVVSATISHRDQLCFDRLRETSRIDEQIDTLDRRLELVQRYVERQRSMRQESQQRRLTFVLGLIAIMEFVVGIVAFARGDMQPWLGWSVAGGGVMIAVVWAVFTFEWYRMPFRG